MDHLLAGYRRFRDGYYAANHKLFEELATRGQRPKTMIIGCADARVDPAITFDTAPGDVFMVRNVANVVPPYAPDGDYHGTSAAIEFAVKGLEVENMVVLGHARCGGIATLVGMNAQAHTTDFIEPWMQVAIPARERARTIAAREGRAADHLRLCHLTEIEGVKTSLTNLMTFPWIAERVADGRLSIHGLYFDITSGALMRLDRTTGIFTPVT
ncbi:MAG TPA: carbonic anhydrase [Micropepsaceae bacterium]|nr:carbonic anhydrase [Micropepsaceae bacterium]HRK71992.1 carbonic anhydrase [Micropepsaceae bacterium]